jgi:hypothetical protein
MLSRTDTTLDLLVLELVLELVRLADLLLGILAPVDAGPEDDVLSNRSRVRDRALAILGRVSELGPCLAIRDAGVYGLLVGDVANATGRLDLVAVFVDAV